MNLEILNTHTKENLSDIFIRKITKSDLDTVLNLFGITINSIFTKDISSSVKDNFINNYNTFSNTLKFTVLLSLFKGTKKMKIAFSSCLIILNYYLNYFEYTIIKYRRYLSNRGYKGMYQCVPIEQIKRLYPDFKYNEITKYLIENKKEFITSRDTKITLIFS
jgi:hypothetical protein